MSSSATTIKILLLTSGVSQAKVADATGVDRATVCKVVAGKLQSGPHAVKAARQIAKMVRRPVAELFPWAA